MYEDDDEMDAPVPCQRCQRIFDLHDGYGSRKWYPNIVICDPCFREEEKEIEKDEELQERMINLSNANFDHKALIKTLRETGRLTDFPSRMHEVFSDNDINDPERTELLDLIRFYMDKSRSIEERNNEVYLANKEELKQIFDAGQKSEGGVFWMDELPIINALTSAGYIISKV